MKSGLRDKVVLITGASGGIGEATARAFAAEGARLVLHGFRNVERAETLAKVLEVEAVAVEADLRREADVAVLFEKGIERFEKIDVLVANAGVWMPEDTPIHAMTLERWNEIVLTDQTSVFLCAREFFKHLAERKPERASVTIVGSTAALFGEEGHADYAAAKAAVVYGLTRTLKSEIVRLVPKGRVNAVCPGWTRTPMAEADLADAGQIRLALQTRAIAEISEPDHVARVIVFLSSDLLAAHVTGAILPVAAGMEGRVLHPEMGLEA